MGFSSQLGIARDRSFSTAAGPVRPGSRKFLFHQTSTPASVLSKDLKLPTITAPRLQEHDLSFREIQEGARRAL